MIDSVSLKIETLASIHGSYIDAVLEFAEEFEFKDFEDIIEVLNPLLVSKIRQEFIEKNFIPSLKSKNSILSFMNE